MDFFQHQDQARRNTKSLVVYFVLAVACIVASVYFVCFFIFGGFDSRHGGGSLWNTDIFIYSALGTLAVIVCGSLYQISMLSSGGSAVAESLGGRLLNPGSTDPQERKLLNIVEEMAIASGVAMPKVYVMDDEGGINAFAAGFSPNDAAVAVPRGCLQNLDRDELQGVIGHEFSHILNGDMRLNIRLMGIIFGIICLATIGRILLRTRGRKNPLPLLGLALIIIGGLGVFFGRLIQSAVSRQREFLADASSVQFTRNPLGLSSALQKLGAIGSRLESERAADACHMFFGNGMSSSLLGMFATHPPIEERIRAIDKSWDGQFPKISDRLVEEITSRRRDSELVAQIISAPQTRPPKPPPATVRAQTILPNIGQPTSLHLRYAEALRNAIPDAVQAAAREPTAASALVFALLVSEEAKLRTQQLEEIARRTSSGVSAQAASLHAEIAPLAARARLPLVNLALAALRNLRPEEFQRFQVTLKWLIESDEQIDLFEFVLQKILDRNLNRHFTPGKPAVTQFYTVKPLVPDVEVLLSALARVSSADEGEVTKAFAAGAPYARTNEIALNLLPSDRCGLPQIDAALNRLALAVPQIKKNMLEAGVRIVGADGLIQEREAEMLRGIAEALECPIPPFVQLSPD